MLAFKKIPTGHWWLTPVILATQEAEVRRIMVQSHPRQIVRKTPSRIFPSHKMGQWSSLRENPEFKPQYHKKKFQTVIFCFPIMASSGKQRRGHS
jgi:hypothetical protein